MKSMAKKYDSLDELVEDYSKKTEMVNQFKELSETELSEQQKQIAVEQKELSNYLQEACQAFDFTRFSTSVKLGENKENENDMIECHTVLDNKEQYVKLYATLTNGGDEAVINALEQNRAVINDFEAVKKETEILGVSTVKELEENTKMAFEMDDIKDAVQDFFENKKEITIEDFENAMKETFDVMDKLNIDKNETVAFKTADTLNDMKYSGKTKIIAQEIACDIDRYEEKHPEIVKAESDKEKGISQIEAVEIDNEVNVKAEVETPEATAEVVVVELPDDTKMVAIDNIIVAQEITKDESTKVLDNTDAKTTPEHNYVGMKLEDMIAEYNRTVNREFAEFNKTAENAEQQKTPINLKLDDIIIDKKEIETPEPKTTVELAHIVPAEPEMNNDKDIKNNAEILVVADDKIVMAENQEYINKKMQEIEQEIQRENIKRLATVEVTVLIGGAVIYEEPSAPATENDKENTAEIVKNGDMLEKVEQIVEEVHQTDEQVKTEEETVIEADKQGEIKDLEDAKEVEQELTDEFYGRNNDDYEME